MKKQKSISSNGKIYWTTEKRKISELIPADYNPRKISEKQANELKKSLERFGQAEPLVVNSNNRLVGGHQRLKILALLGDEEVSVSVPHRPLTPKEEMELNLRLNRNLGDWEYKLLNSFDHDMLKDCGFEGYEIDKAFSEVRIDAEDDVPDVDEGNCKVKEGDIYLLGNNKIMCGSSTDINCVKKLFGNEYAELCLTDPPYSVKYKSRKNKTNKTLDSYQDPDDPRSLLNGFMSIMPTNNIIMTYAGKQTIHLALVSESLGFNLLELLVWKKQNFCFHMGARYQYQHEPIFILSKKTIKNNTPSNQSSVFEIDRMMKNDIHPTQKPLELFERLLLNHTDEGDLVYEPFSGSGTTLIVCEKHRRKCYAIEISNLFVDVCIRRWEEFTGKKAVKL